MYPGAYFESWGSGNDDGLLPLGWIGDLVTSCGKGVASSEISMLQTNVLVTIMHVVVAYL